jgi:hypothetical protein
LLVSPSFLVLRSMPGGMLFTKSSIDRQSASG